MDDTLRQKIIQELRTSGLPLELDSVHKLREFGFHVRQNIHYEQGSTQGEIDLVASQRFEYEREERSDEAGVTLIVECKRSRDKPWVFLAEPADPFDRTLTDSLQYATTLPLRTPSDFMVLGLQTFGSHHYREPHPRARTYFEAMKNHSRREIFEAVRSVLHGIVAFKRWILAEWRDAFDARPPRYHSHLIHGVIVFDGVLALAKRGGDDFEVQEVPNLLLRTSELKSFRWYPRESFQETIIDVVHIDALEKLKDFTARDLECLREHIGHLWGVGLPDADHGKQTS